MHDRSYVAELETCVRCGSCKVQCPTYSEGLSEAAGARGRLSILAGLSAQRLQPSASVSERIFSCLLCGACEHYCPPTVNVTEAIYHGRDLLRHTYRRGRVLRQLMRFAFKRPAITYKTAQLLHTLWHPLLQKGGKLPYALNLPHSTLRDGHHIYKPKHKRGRIAFFTGCSTNYLFPHLGLSLINVLLKLGYEVVLPQGEVCCGAPLRSMGFEEDARALAGKNYQLLNRLNAEAIISLCPTCMLFLKKHYTHLLGKELKHVVDLSTFLLDNSDALRLSRLEGLQSVAYHDPCHSYYSFGIKKEPRDLIRLMGLELREPDEEGCCGFGGIFSLLYRDISRNLLKKRVDAYTQTGVSGIVSSCPGCVLQLGAGMRDKPVFHLVELIDEALEG